MFVYIAAARDGYFIRDTMNSTTAGFDYGGLVGRFQLFLFLKGIFFSRYLYPTTRWVETLLLAIYVDVQRFEMRWLCIKKWSWG